jgi:hypothetical protein
MADTTAVNAQITDAVTRSNAKLLAELPAYAATTIYQAVAQSTAIALQDAVAAQQNQNILAIAAASESLTRILVGPGGTVQTMIAERLTSLPKALEAMVLAPASTNAASVAGAPQSVEASVDETDAPQADAAGTDAKAVAGDRAERVAEEVKSAVDFANDTVLDHGPAITDAVEAATAALVESIDALNRVNHLNHMRLIQRAALAAALAGMLREPEKQEQYSAMIQTIEGIYESGAP